MCCNADTGLMPPGGGGGSAVLVWGNDNVGAAADTRFLAPGHDIGVAPIVDVMQFVAPRAGTLKNLFARHNSAAGNGNNIVYTVLVNGAPTIITVALATGAIGQASDLVNQVVIAQGDRISVQAVKAAVIATGAIDVQVSLTMES